MKLTVPASILNCYQYVKYVYSAIFCKVILYLTLSERPGQKSFTSALPSTAHLPLRNDSAWDLDGNLITL